MTVADTAIEWTEQTWNPTTGCDKISAGCDNCYALKLAGRLKAMGQAKYQTDGDPRTSGPGFGLAVHPGTLAEPFRWRQPTTVFVNSMSDLFHAKVPLEFIQRVFAVMAATPRHTYQILTKRARRLRRLAPKLDWSPNVWMGVSVENSEPAVVRRVDELRQVPAAVRFLSCEPLLSGLPNLNLDGITWVIAGGESGGTKARPMHPDWARSLRDQCQAENIAFFFKQWGDWVPAGLGIGLFRAPERLIGPPLDEMGHRQIMRRVGKHASGRMLDGRTWNEYPAAGRDVEAVSR